MHAAFPPRSLPCAPTGDGGGPTATTSGNTAGAEADCAASGYKCADVSGLCHQTCSSSGQCSGGHSCNPCNNKCENNTGPITQC